MNDEKLKPNIEYMRQALRFLKIAGLIPCWMSYIEDKEYNRRYVEHHTERHWSNKPFLSEVFGETTFTLYLRNKYKVKVVDYYFVVDLFNDYIKLMKVDKEKAYKLVKTHFMRLKNVK